MNKKAKDLRELGFVVQQPDDIAPHKPAITLQEKWEDMNAFYEEIDRSDSVFVANEDPHIGLATAMEISRALTQGKEVMFENEPEQLEFKALIYFGKAKVVKFVVQ